MKLAQLLSREKRESSQRALRDAQSSVRRTTAQQVLVTVGGHPVRSFEVRVVSPPRAVGIAIRVAAENEASDLAPVCAVTVRVEEAQVGDRVRLIVARQDSVRGCDWGDHQARRRRHWGLPKMARN